MKRLRKCSRAAIISGLSILAICLLCGCQAAAYYVPPVATAEMARSEHVDLATLRRGRQLFAYRCIQCHTAPSVWHYDVDEWPPIVDSMAHRASLKPSEREAILAYIRVVRAQQ
jgi:cytochrome c5